ncbi:MAG: thermonuclease family protein [Candidatus Thiodubiliella endoseptemdiera]|uniref:Thermonuclease family protein n=1 Tax=Candidatus Thiodubiliella endoseptemdiera TaxID=2738886 RepID=A0A853F434_9GAMM|nr:thermonuclease family protein [Candidatus Thiodubiliella endoseptemdiera]
MRLFIFCILLASNAFADIENFVLDSEKTLYIVDGDSVSLQMRIANIDTPEITQPCQKIQGNNIDCGRLAKDYLKRLLTNTDGRVAVTPIAIGYYKRVLIQLHKGNTDIAKAMVGAGMAFAYGDVYKQEETTAKSKKLGFWGFYQPPLTPRQYRKSNTYKYSR